MRNLIYTDDNLESLEKQKRVLEKKKEQALLLKDIIPSIKEKDKVLEQNIYKLIHSIQKQIDTIIFQINDIKTGISIIEESKKEQLLKNFPKGSLQKPPHISTHKLQESIIPKNNKFYEIQGLLSDSQDYYNLGDNISRNRANELTKFTILNPERISDNLLIKLGFIYSKDFKNLSQEEKLKRKKESIDRLKNIIENSINLTINGDNKTTGRIQMINSINEPSFGKIICFQTLRFLDSENQSFYEKIALIFDDIYDCYRSQLHTSNKLKDIEKQMQEIGLILVNLIQIWKDENISKKSKKEKLNKIIKDLKKFEKYYIQRASQNRLKKVNFKHLGNDKSLLEGAKNDIKKAYLTILSQRMNIDKQSKILDFIIKQEDVNWNTVYDRFLKIIDKFDQEDLILCFDNVIFGNNLKLNDIDIKEFFNKGENKKLLKDIKNVLNSYKIMGIDKFCPSPFLEFHYEIEKLNINLKSSLNSNNFKEVLRIIFYTNILFKLQKYKLFLHKLENDLKLKNFHENNILNYLNELKDIKKTLSERCFLSAIKYEENSKIHQKFLYNNEIINKIAEFLKNKKYKELLKLLKQEKNN